MSAMSNRTDDQDRLSSAKEETEIGSAVVMETAAEINARRLQAYIEESARSLHQVLDEQLVGTEWNSDVGFLIHFQAILDRNDFCSFLGFP